MCVEHIGGCGKAALVHDAEKRLHRQELVHAIGIAAFLGVVPYPLRHLFQLP